MNNRHFVLRSVPPLQAVIAEGDAPTFKHFLQDQLRQNKAILRGADLRNRQLSGLVMPRGADCTGADFSGATLNYMKAPDAIFDMCRFHVGTRGITRMFAAYLRGSSIKLSSFHGADLTALDIQDADLRHSIFDHCKMSSLRAARATFDDATINACTLLRATLVRASFNDGVVARSDLRGAFLVSAERKVTREQAGLDAAELYAGMAAGQNIFSSDTAIPRTGPFRTDYNVFQIMRKAIYLPSLVAGMYIDAKVEALHVPQHIESMLGITTSHPAAGSVIVAGSIAAAALAIRVIETVAEEKIRDGVGRAAEILRAASGRFTRAIAKPCKLAYLVARKGTFGPMDQILRAHMETWRSVENHPRGRRRAADIEWFGDVPVSKLLLRDMEVIIVRQTDMTTLLAKMRAARTHEKHPVLMISDRPFSPEKASIPASITFDRGGHVVVRFRDRPDGPDIFAGYDPAGQQMFLARGNNDKTPIPPEIVKQVKAGVWSQIDSFVAESCTDYHPLVEFEEVRHRIRGHADLAPAVPG